MDWHDAAAVFEVLQLLPFVVLGDVDETGAVRSDLDVVGAGIARQPDVDLLRDGLDALDAPGGTFGRQLLCVAGHVPAQGDHAVLCADSDTGRIDAGLELQLVHHQLPELSVVHGALLRGRVWGST